MPGTHQAVTLRRRPVVWPCVLMTGLFSVSVVFLAVFGIIRQTWGLKGAELDNIKAMKQDAA